MKFKHRVESDKIIACYEKNGNNAIKNLVGFYQGYYHNFVLSAVFYAIKHSPVWLLPIFTANIINAVVAKDPDVNRIILVNVAILIFLLILNIPMNYLHMHFRASAVRDVEAGLRSALVRKIQKISVLTEMELQSGRLQSKIIRDVEAVETISDQLFVSLLNIIINIAVALVVTASRSLVVFIFFLLMVPLAGFLVYFFKKPIKEHNRLFRKQVEVTGARVSEMVSLVPVTRAHALEDEEIVKMEGALKLVAEEGYQLDMVQTNFGAVSWACFQIFQVICLAFTSFLAVRALIETGDVVLYQSYFTTIVGQISSLLNLLPTISKGLESVNSIGEVLLIDDVEDDTGKTELSDLKGDYVFENVSFQYKDAEERVIHKLDFQVKAGETVAFVGESGAGKSTIMNLLIGFCMPTEGVIRVDGIPTEELNLKSYRKHLAVVPQNTVLFSGTIRDNILYGTSGVSEETLNRVIDEAGLRSVIEGSPEGLDRMVGERGDKLSGGQKQRISIARALIREPKVIILDEATSALDAVSEREVTEAINKISGNTTMFIVAHKLETIKNADRIIVMRRGEVVETGTFTELMEKQGYFSVLYATQEKAG